LWAGNGDPLSDLAVDAIDAAHDAREPLAISAISAWEIGLLVSRNRLSLPQPVPDWFAAFVKGSRCKVEHLDTDILVSSSFLPGDPPKDPADRMVIATARHTGRMIVTRDRRILGYAEDGHVKAIPC